ncbi:MAG TPA: hypothetical protein VFS50_14330 [Meiothermus sp.]|nr:hypothetical protein [Meiothermus sp.]
MTCRGVVGGNQPAPQHPSQRSVPTPARNIRPQKILVMIAVHDGEA